MATDADFVVVCRVGQPQWIFDPPHGTHRVPYPDKIRLAGRRKRLFELGRELERGRRSASFVTFGNSGVAVDPGEHADRVGNERTISPREQSVNSQKGSN